MSKRVIVAKFDAVGGPGELVNADDGFVAGPTDAGTYRMSHCGKHSSPSYKHWSTVRWGSDIRALKDGTVEVMHDGKWRKLSEVTIGMTKDDLIKRNFELYGRNELPAKWLFNDFGHMTCYFYKDKNANGRLDRDAGEKIHTEYFHTTPDDEATDAGGGDVSLSLSHGCIHLKPKDIDAMIAAGYFASGNSVVVHKYSAKVPAWDTDEAGTKPFEVHFFPGASQVVVTGRRPRTTTAGR